MEAGESYGRVLALQRPAVVIDVGTGYTKAGFSSEDKPRCVFASKLCIPSPVLGEGICYSDDIALKRPLVRGVVEDWDAMENLLHNTFYSRLKVDPSSQPVLLSDSPCSSGTNREMAAELLFESFSVPALHVAHSCVLALLSCGRCSGLVVDTGDGASLVCSVLDGSILRQTLYWLDITGRSLNHHLKDLLSWPRKTQSYEKKLLRDIKHTCCYVSLNFCKELQKALAPREHVLPDGQIIRMGSEKFHCPEPLFQPRILGTNEPGLHIMVFRSLLKVDPACRQPILQSILLCGGSSLFPGFTERMKKELNDLIPVEMEFNVLDLAHRKRRWYAPWLGGAVASSLPVFQNLWLGKAEFEEKGPSSLHRKFT